MLSFVVTLETLTPPATALAAAEAAGMPVRRPRRPAAVSAADAADAEPPPHLRRPARAGRQTAHRRGEVPPGRFVCVCLSVGRVWSGDQSPVLVSSVWDRVRVLGLWVSHSR